MFFPSLHLLLSDNVTYFNQKIGDFIYKNKLCNNFKLTKIIIVWIFFSHPLVLHNGSFGLRTTVL